MAVGHAARGDRHLDRGLVQAAAAFRVGRGDLDGDVGALPEPPDDEPPELPDDGAVATLLTEDTTPGVVLPPGRVMVTSRAGLDLGLLGSVQVDGDNGGG